MNITTDFLIGLGLGVLVPFIVEKLIGIVNMRQYNKVLLEVSDKFKRLRDMSDDEIANLIGEELMEKMMEAMVNDSKE